ncbi:MAG: type II secretion system protein GspG [Spirochaetia bacterium]|nr:type II secretion system protein GspG [Spirochaetia bacterium]
MKIKELRKKRGMTLIELMVVIVILGTLMTVLYIGVFQNPVAGQADEFQLKRAKEQIEVGLFQFRQKFGRFPSTDEGLDALINCPPGIPQEKYPSTGLLLNKNAIIGPNQVPYYYINEDGKYKIIYLGKDGQQGGEGENADIDLSEL